MAALKSQFSLWRLLRSKTAAVSTSAPVSWHQNSRHAYVRSGPIRSSSRRRHFAQLELASARERRRRVQPVPARDISLEHPPPPAFPCPPRGLCSALLWREPRPKRWKTRHKHATPSLVNPCQAGGVGGEGGTPGRNPTHLSEYLEVLLEVLVERQHRGDVAATVAVVRRAPDRRHAPAREVVLEPLHHQLPIRARPNARAGGGGKRIPLSFACRRSPWCLRLCTCRDPPRGDALGRASTGMQGSWVATIRRTHWGVRLV